MNFHDQLSQFVNGYVNSRKEEFAGHPIGNLVRNMIPKTLYESLVDESRYLIKGSVGQGNWANIPWICIFDRAVTTKATKGVYIVYLLSEDGERLYLTLNQGCTDLLNRLRRPGAVLELKRIAKDISDNIGCGDFDVRERIDLGENISPLSKLYEDGTICYRRYDRENLPSEEELLSDLQEMIDIYTQYANKRHLLESTGSVILTDSSGFGEYSEGYSEKVVLEEIKRYIASKGFSYEEGTIENFYLSLKSKPFVILAGISGTGKTRLVKLFAEAIGANVANGRFKLVSVRPDWSDSTDLFGHTDLNGRFVPGSLIDFIHAAANDSDKPYILCLDEMNLARVEYYLSDFLSIMETADINQEGYIETDQLLPSTYFGADLIAAEKYKNLRLTQNLYLIGTVNMDETTFPFSRKVLDRANTIELSYVNLLPDHLLTLEESLDPKERDNEFLKAQCVQLIDCKHEYEYVYQLCQELEQLNNMLETAGFQCGYRIRDEIAFYMVNNKKVGLLEHDQAMDFQILQKILPRIQGSSTAIKEMLDELFKYLASDYEGYQVVNDNLGDRMLKHLKDHPGRYPKSASKVAFMVRRFEEDGFTSYWL